MESFPPGRAKGKQTDATLIFDDSDKDLLIRVADRDFVTIPYDQVDKFTYEYTKKHRITTGAIVMVASLGAGAVVMMAKSKSHWLYIDYHDQQAPKTVVTAHGEEAIHRGSLRPLKTTPAKKCNTPVRRARRRDK